MTTIQEVKLVELRRKKIKYQNQIYTVSDFKQLTSYLVVYTERKTFNFLPHEIDSFLDDIDVLDKSSLLEKDLDDESLPENNKDNEETSLSFYEPTSDQKKVQKALIDMLDKVQDDKKYIPQAKAVCEIANAMVGMERSQLSMILAAKKLGR